MTKKCLFKKITNHFQVRHIETRDFFRVSHRFAHAVFCLRYLRPYDGTIGTNGIINGNIGKTLNGIFYYHW